MARGDDSASVEQPTSRRRLARACGARVKGGRYCRQPPGAGTDHLGVGLCARHGGNSPHNLKRAGMVLAHEGVMNPDIHPGDIIEIEPHNALLWAVMIGAGDVSYWQQQVAALGKEVETAEQDDESEDAEVREQQARAALRQAFQQMRQANKEMRSSSKMAIDAGLQERQILMAERMAGILTTFAQTVFSQIDISPRDMERLPALIHAAILQLQAPDGHHAPKPKMALIAHKIDEVIEVDAE